jgi:hypothetical protein
VLCQRRRAGLLDGDKDLIARRQASGRQAGGHHAHVAKDRRADQQGRPPPLPRSRRIVELRDHIRHAAGMDDARRDRGDVGWKRGKVRFRRDDLE